MVIMFCYLYMTIYENKCYLELIQLKFLWAMYLTCSFSKKGNHFGSL